jgi:hypothetical protein
MGRMMAAQRRRIAQAIAALGPRGRTSRVPDVVRAEVVAYARARRADGTSWRAIAGEIGFSVTAVQGWATRAHGALVPVAVRAEPVAAAARALVLVTPTGLRVEGADVGTVVALVRALA